MARYRKIDVRMWRDRRFMGLTAPEPNGRDCWIYLLTNAATSNIPGLYHAYEESLARGLGWPLEAFREAFAEVVAHGMAKADWSAGLVFIPNAVKYDPPQSPNVIKGWADTWDELPECPLKAEAHARLKALVASIGSDSFCDAFAESCPLPHFDKGCDEVSAQSFPKASSAARDGDAEEALANPDPDPDPDPEPDPEETSVGPKKTSPPLQADTALGAIANASGGRFVAMRLNRAQAINAHRLIRAHPDLAEWQLVGEWLGAGGEAWKIELDARSLGSFDAWLGHAQKWRDNGKPPIERHASRASPQRRDPTRGQVPVVEGLDYSSAGGAR